MQGGEHEVTGLGERERDRDRVEVAHLTEEDDVGVLTKGAAQTVGEAVHVGAHLALVDHRGLVEVQVFDRVLDGEDVTRLLLVDLVDHRGERRALARTGGAHDEHESVRLVQQVDRGQRRAELVEVADTVGHHAQGEGERAALLEGVGAESSDVGETEAEVDLTVFVDLLLLTVVEQREHHALGVGPLQDVDALERHEDAVAARRGGAAGGEVEVAGAGRDGCLQQGHEHRIWIRHGELTSSFSALGGAGFCSVLFWFARVA